MSTILIIDDDEGILMLVKAALRRANLHSLLANNGHQGIQMAESNLPDIIILDDTMPRMSGREVCMALKDNPRTRHIPVIISSASMQTNDPQYAQALGADGLLIKPFHPQDMLNLVYSFLDPA